MERIRRALQTGNVYAEHRPLLWILQLSGIAPFVVRRNAPESSRLHPLAFLIQSTLMLYCLHDSKLKKQFSKLSSYSLTALFYDFSSILGTCYTVLTLAKFLRERKTCMRMWSTLEEINRGMREIGAGSARSRIWNVLKSSSVLIGYGAFVALTYNLQSNKSRLTAPFWMVWYLPLFHFCLIEMTFHVFCSDLTRKFEIARLILEKDVKALRAGRRKLGLCDRVRSIREIHFKGYEIAKDLNSMYGLHFFYIFVTYFLGITLNFCIIIRLLDKTDPVSIIRYRSAVYWTVIEVAQILNIVFSGVFLKEEVCRMRLLIQHYLAFLDENESHLKLELQSFSLQLLQCSLDFTAAGFFQIDCTFLIELSVAIISNTLFFVQIDKLKNRG